MHQSLDTDSSRSSLFQPDTFHWGLFIHTTICNPSSRKSNAVFFWPPKAPGTRVWCTAIYAGKILWMRAHEGWGGAPGGKSNQPLTSSSLRPRIPMNPRIRPVQDDQDRQRGAFSCSKEAARQIVKRCRVCPKYFPVPHLGVNPRGLLPNHLWWSWYRSSLKEY